MPVVQSRLAAALADRYRLERELGKGGMATVYLAQDLKHDRKVAIKVLRPELGASLGADRFLQEIRVAAKLQHPHIVGLLDSGVIADGAGPEVLSYYVMPFVEGETLRERLARTGPLAVPEVVRLTGEVADALAKAHKAGVVHRDIKPENILLADGHALVMDFGVAKAVSDATGRQGLTSAGLSLGTPAYMAPEQVAADPRIDHRADLYALGLVAYEMLVGGSPYAATTPQQQMAAHVTQAPAPIHLKRPDCPPALAALIMRCLSKNPDERWQSAEDVVTRLGAVETMTPHRVSWWTRRRIARPRRGGRPPRRGDARGPASGRPAEGHGIDQRARRAPVHRARQSGARVPRRGPRRSAQRQPRRRRGHPERQRRTPSSASWAVGGRPSAWSAPAGWRSTFRRGCSWSGTCWKCKGSSGSVPRCSTARRGTARWPKRRWTGSRATCSPWSICWPRAWRRTDPLKVERASRGRPR